MKEKIFYVLLLILVGCSLRKVSNTDSNPPKAEKIAYSETVHGVELKDDYHWLKDKSRTDENVIAYVEAENKYAEKILSKTEELKNTVLTELKSRLNENDLSLPVLRDSFYYYWKVTEGKQYWDYYRKKVDSDTEEAVMPINEMSKGYTYYEVSSIDISPDHSMLGFLVDTSGSEQLELKFIRISDHHVFKDSVANVSSAAWANDNKTIFYVQDDETGRGFRLYRHTLNTPVSQDQLIFEEKDGRFYLWTGVTKSKKYIMFGSGSKTSNECYFVSADNPFEEFQLIEPRTENMTYYADDRGDYFYIQTDADSSYNWKLVKTPINNPGRENWETVIPHREDVYVLTSVYADFISVYERKNAIEKFRIMPFDGSDETVIEFDEAVYSASLLSVPNFDTDFIRYSYESYTQPAAIFDFDVKTEKKTLRKKLNVKGEYNADLYKSERIFAVAEDGTKIPVSLLYRKDLFKKDGSNSLLLYSYGSYGSGTYPYFSSSRLSLLDRGFIYADAHIRGGNEMGRMWHYKGRMLSKKNTFTDFIACAEKLIEDKYTSPEHLGIEGGSAGGMLMGAVTNMRPDLFETVIADVPFVDVLNTMSDPSLSATVSEYEEWGNPEIKKYFDYIRSYCPYQNVKKQNYPNIFAIAGFYDPRVNYWEPAKWVAKIREMNTSDSVIILKTNMNAGHGGSSGRYDFLEEIAEKYAFLIETLK